nr:phosphatidylinositol-glycan biosynthesis class F protein [Ipomoea trifida]
MATKKQPKHNVGAPKGRKNFISSVSPLKACFLHLICGLGLASALWAARNIYSDDLVSNPAQTLRLILASESPVVILLYSLFRHDLDRCSYFKALGRGLLGLPVGAAMIAVGAIILGAPVGFQYLGMTLYWSLVMSVFTFVPAATVFGSSWTDWHRIFAQTKPAKNIDYMVFFPAHGAIIGAWFGAWPMPLDWERPWQVKAVEMSSVKGEAEVDCQGRFGGGKTERIISHVMPVTSDSVLITPCYHQCP